MVAIRKSELKVNPIGEVEGELGKISSLFSDRSFSERIISSVNVATTYRDDIDQRKVSRVITNERHSKVTPENLARMWNIGIDTAKRTLQVTTQRGI
jgi:hypothetical protein